MGYFKRQKLSLILLIANCLILKSKHKKRVRSVYVRKLLQKRDSHGEFYHLVQEMRLYDHETHFAYFRMSPEQFDNLLTYVGPSITKSLTHACPVSPAERLAVTLRYLATGDSHQTISYSFRLGKSTVSSIVRETCIAIWDSLQPIVLKSPDLNTFQKISEDFWNLWNFPNCLGAIDGKHIRMQAPKLSGSTYFNYKGYFSLVLLAVCDANYRFTIVDIGAAGKESDGGIFANSVFGKMLTQNKLTIPEPKRLPGSDVIFPHCFIGDEGFPLKSYMMRPYPGKHLPEIQKIFNYRLSRSRRIIENSFGILAARWRIFHRTIIANVDKVEAIIKATCCLHNYLKIADDKQADRRYCPPNFVDVDDRYDIIPGDWRRVVANDSGMTDIGRIGSNMHTQDAADLRETLSNYFVTQSGELSWQYNYVRRGQILR